jgi:hypothetical protein
MEAGGDVPVAAANPGAHRFHFFASSLVNVSQSLGFSSPISCYPLLLIFVEFYLLLFLVFPFASHFRRERNATTRRERERNSATCLRFLPAATQTPPLRPASTTAAQQSTAAGTGAQAVASSSSFDGRWEPRYPPQSQNCLLLPSVIGCSRDVWIPARNVLSLGGDGDGKRMSMGCRHAGQPWPCPAVDLWGQGMRDSSVGTRWGRCPASPYCSVRLCFRCNSLTTHSESEDFESHYFRKPNA